MSNNKNVREVYFSILALLRTETDPVRKQALKTKLEELKKILEEQQTINQVQEQKEAPKAKASRRNFVKQDSEKEAVLKRIAEQQTPESLREKALSQSRMKAKNEGSTKGQISVKNLDHYSSPYKKDCEMALRRSGKKH